MTKKPLKLKWKRTLTKTDHEHNIVYHADHGEMTFLVGFYKDADNISGSVTVERYAWLDSGDEPIYERIDKDKNATFKELERDIEAYKRSVLEEAIAGLQDRVHLIHSLLENS